VLIGRSQSASIGRRAPGPLTRYHGGTMTRRAFVHAGAAAGATALARPVPGDVKPSLYSVTYLGLWYRGEALTMEQLLERARRFGYEGVEIEAKRPHGCPLDWPKSRAADFRKRAHDKGLAITGVAAMNDFSSPISDHREAQLSAMRDLIRMTADLDAKILRVFLAWTGAHPTPEGGARYDLAQKVWQYTHEGVPEEQTWPGAATVSSRPRGWPAITASRSPCRITSR